MAKIKIFFDDLKDSTKEKLWEAVKKELQDEIKETQYDPEVIENEVDDYINRNNSGTFFEV